MRITGYFAAIILLTFAPVALADSIQFTVNSSVQVSRDSPNSNYWGEYRTLPDAFGTTSQVNAGFPPIGGVDTIFPNVSFFLPAGSVVTSATMNLILPSTAIEGTGHVVFAGNLPPPDPENSLQTPPILGPATSSFYVDDIFLQGNGTSSEGNFFPNVPIINGNQIFTGTWDLDLVVSGEVVGMIDTQGFNWDGYIGGDGQADIPYSVQVDVNYTPVPEPPPFILLGTAMTLGLVGIVHRKWSAS